MKYKEIKEKLEILESAQNNAKSHEEKLNIQYEINRLNNLDCE